MLVSELHVGQRASVTKVFLESDVAQFAELSLDKNPIHLDQDFAASTVFGRRIVHGMLVASLFSGILGQKMPGEGTIYLGGTIQFVGPVFIDEPVTAFVEITKIREDKPIVTLKTWCENPNGEIVVDGEAVVKVLAA
jgi:enoyl-CoA hydratase